MKHHILLLVLLFSQLFLSAQQEKPIFFVNDVDTLYGTTLVPAKKTQIGVLIIAGSGPTDRNGLNPLGVKFPSYKLIAEGLANNGILSIRFDKRGIGESARAYKSAETATMDIYVKDIEMGIKKMKKEFPFIKKWVVLGHSEGALLGAAAILNESVDRYISLSGTCEDLLSIIEKQLMEQIPVANHHLFKIPIDSLKAGYTVTKYPPILNSVFTPSIQPYYISSNKYAANKILPQLKIPILIVNGDTDIQVKVKDAECLKLSQSKAELLIISKMNHILKLFEGDLMANIKNYADPNGELHPDLIPALVKFIKEK